MYCPLPATRQGQFGANGMAKTYGEGFNLKGKVAVITGAAAGIGRAVSALFAAQGASLVMLDLSPEVHELAEKLRESLAPMIETVIRQECLRIADQVAEKVAWEVIPDLAENIIRKEIKALTDAVE